MSSIRALPPDVAAQLKSSVNIVSLNDAVLGLIKNSLDAKSTQIHVDVDFARGSCNVEDDGEGIAALEFQQDGGLGLPFHTSKHRAARPQHGSTGVFLASLGGISVLTIYSRRTGEKERSCLLLYRSQRLPARGVQAAHQQLRSRKHGTRVSVQDLFGSMPVRVKQRSSGEEGKSNREKMWKSLCYGCFAVVIASGADVSFTMQAQDKDHLLRLRPLSVDRQVASSSVLGFDAARACNLLSQRLGLDHQSWASWVQTAANDDDISVRGLVCKRGSPSRDTQLLALGIHPLLPDGEWALLFEKINKVFAASSFGSQETLSLPVADRRNLVQLDHDADKLYRYPMFFVKISCSDIGLKPYPQTGNLKNRSAAKIENMIEAMMIGFLKNQGYQPKKRVRRKAFEPTVSSPPADTSTEMAKSGRSYSGVAWGRMKQGATHRAGKTSVQAYSARQSDQDADEILSAFDETEALALCREIEPITALSGDSLVSWVDPKNGERIRVNDRTGMVENIPLEFQTRDQAQGRQVMSRGDRLTLDKDHGDCPHEQARRWANGFAEHWENPVFDRREEAILTVNQDDESLERLALFQQSGIEPQRAIYDAFKQQSTTSDSRITREDLQVAKIMGQVDRKFILATAEKGQRFLEGEVRAQPVVFIIDQHAADERVRVEALLEDLCRPLTLEQQPIPEHPYPSKIATVRLERPLSLAVGIDEAKLFERYAPHFAAWGILYLVSAMEDTESATFATRSRPNHSPTLLVLTLPSVIAERCRVDLTLLRNLMIKEVWARDEAGPQKVPDALASAEFTITNTTSKAKQWLHRIHDCPKGLLDMVNSRSCRSAIMFNDELTLRQCQDLVKRLSDCVFPFQCAHGRPSMLPLSIADVFGSTTGDLQELDFARAYRDWK